ncbi:sugar transferase [uncultured Rossellomorea sp.]|uniref:sugar transferase n=1 Tax=uncultured Rossellomorea sp. TaxID=2837549 RepID=UPI00263116D7|nr:sugar transferase [uncultured Rossellomorea sp.]
MYKISKRIFDIILSLILLIIISPIMGITAIIVKLDSPGPILFKQKRVGKDGEDFTIFKFRTMVVNAEKIGTGLDSYANDTRVTKVGKVLRNSSLDELPQLFNILRGDMSFVGPRPPVTYHPYKYNDYPPSAKRRFEVKPGVTGYAQINGRNELSWDQKFKYDLYYTENKSFMFDLKIFILTIFKVLKMEGSYDVDKNEKAKH